MSENKKVVIKVDVHDEKDKSKAMGSVFRLSGIKSVNMDMKDKKLTLIGDVDPLDVVRKLKKWNTEIVTVGPEKEEKKKEEPKKEEVDNKKKKEEEEERMRRIEELERCAALRGSFNPCMTQQYCVHVVDDCPGDGCVIC